MGDAPFFDNTDALTLTNIYNIFELSTDNIMVSGEIKKYVPK